MEINKELVNDLNAVIHLRFSPTDYQPKIDAQLKEYSRKVSLPGFRPGKVPAGMIRKMYGKSILAEELNKLTSDSLFNFIRDNELDILGNPLPHEKNDQVDFENPGEINFAFDVALAPKFDVDISSNHRFNFYAPQIGDSFIDENIENYRQRLGESSPVEVSEANDVIEGNFEELDSNGAIIPEGIQADGEIRFENLNEDQKAKFIGLTVGQTITLDPKETFISTEVVSNLLDVPVMQAEELTSSFQFSVKAIKRVIPAELNQEFFDKLFGKDVVFSEAELRAKIAADASERFRKDSDNRFFNEVVEHLVNNAGFELPDEFLKRWLVSVNEGKVAPSDIEGNYSNYSKGIRWQLIEGKILKDNNIQVTEDQVLDSLTDDFLGYMGAGDNANEEMRNRAREIAGSMLKNEKEVNKIYDRLYKEAMSALFLSKFDVHTVELPFDEWVKQLNSPLN